MLTAATGALALRLRGQRPALPHLGEVPAFRLQERSGREVTREDLKGTPWLANFIFTRCSGVCPAMTAQLSRLRPRVPGPLRFVSVTVDPAHDTPAVLADYARRSGAGAEWLFLTGTQRDLFRLATEGFKLAAFEVPDNERTPGDDGPFLHSSKFVLVDGAGVIRGYYDSADEAEMTSLVRDAARLPATP